jgi:tetratricopeptide (TPR) repeat protein
VRRRDTIPSLFEERGKGGHARRILRQYEELFRGKPELDVLRILGLFDRPADKGALRILRTMGEDQWAGALENLAEARLVQYKDPDGPLDCHPLVREHFAEEFRTSEPEAFRDAHAKLYEHYSKQAPHRPDTLDQMVPLFYAVYHGCQAGKHQEACDGVYFERIRRGNETYLIHRLGAVGVDLSLVSNFFVTPWTAAVPALMAADQSWVAAQAAYSLRALGRLREAIEPWQAAADAAVASGTWTNAATRFSNLSELHLTLGNIPGAVDAARRSVDLADRSGDEFERLSRRTTLADALHQSGDLSGAAQLFEEAKRIQAKRQPEYPLLYSLQGYQYCDLLLAQGEGNEVLRRAAETLEAGELFYWLLDIALDHLSLGRADSPGSPEALDHLNEAVSRLRRAGQLHYLPCGLLARAAHFRHTGEFEKAQQDIDEVRILATRCGMRLHLADYNLEQARLFLAEQKPEEARTHYESARSLVEETGYHRRDSELAELETMLNMKPASA